MSKKKQTVKPDLQEHVEELENKWKRALADYQNLEKRISTQQANYIKLANMGLIDKLLPIMDDLKRAASHIKDAGIDMIVKQFEELLASEGVVKIDVLGKQFDPVMMDCVEMTSGEVNTVVRVIQEGYMIDTTVIRPAKVEVGTGSEQVKTINTKEVKEE